MNTKEICWVCRSCAAIHSDLADLPEACRADALRADFETLEIEAGGWSLAGVEYLPTGSRLAA
jgi:hypothetical protein